MNVKEGIISNLIKAYVHESVEKGNLVEVIAKIHSENSIKDPTTFKVDANSIDLSAVKETYNELENNIKLLNKFSNEEIGGAIKEFISNFHNNTKNIIDGAEQYIETKNEQTLVKSMIDYFMIKLS